MKADLHIHSAYSYNSIAKPASILTTAAEKEIDIIAVTDYNTTQSWREFKMLEKHFPVQIVYGQEVKILKHEHIQGEMLCLFLEKPITSHDVKSVMQETVEQGGIPVLARPFCERRGEFAGYYDITDWQHLVIEARNGRIYNERDNEMAQILADQLSAPVIAGSDAHTPFEIGSVYTEFDGKTVDDLKKAIISKETRVRGVASSPFFSIMSGFGRLGVSL